MQLKPMDFTGKWVLVSGASSGLGEMLARKLALHHKANLIVVARRKAQLEKLKEELESQAKIQVQAICADLSLMEEADRVVREATAEKALYAAILNAGVTHFGDHAELDWGQFEKMLQLNVSSVVRMTQPLLNHFRHGQLGGGLMFVSSMAGLIPIPYQAAYSGTKAFLMNFGCALAEELRGQPVSLTVYAPGGIQTEMTNNESFAPLSRWLMPVDQAAREGLEAFQKRRQLHVPGVGNRVGSYLAGLVPREFLISRVGATYRNALKKANTSNNAQ